MDVLLITITELRMYQDLLSQAWRWNIIIFDEAHKVKNAESKTFDALCKIKADFKLMITATPLINSVIDLWNLMFVVNHDYIGELLRDYKFPEKDPDAVTLLNLVC